MTASNRKQKLQSDEAALRAEVRQLKERLAAAEDTLRAIRAGHVDGVVISGASGDELFALAGAENAYRAFVEAIQEGAVTLARDGTILYCNHGFAQMISRPLEKVIGAKISDLVAPQWRSTMAAAVEQSHTSGVRLELQMLAGDGRHVPVLVSLSDFKEFGARATSMVVTDLTEQKRQEELLAAGRLASLIVEKAVEGIAVCDSNGRIVLASAALRQLCGVNPLLQQFDTVLPLQVEDVGGSGPAAPFSVSEIIAGKTYLATEVTLQRSDGDARHLLLNAGPVPLVSEQTSGCVITLFDIEERRRTEHALRRAERLAATGRLAATIAHEINNPLEGVTNLLYLIGNDGSISPTLGQYVRLAEAELARVSHITKQTLAFHRDSQSPVAVSIKELVESVTYLYAKRVAAKNLRLQMELEYEGDVIGYPTELRQVLANLFENAIEACAPEGQLRVRVYPSMAFNHSEQRGVRIVVADNGGGISPQHRMHIFEPFFTTKGERGSGLGLWVSHGIIVKHGGEIRLRSSTRDGRSGTVFSVFLPFRKRSGESNGAFA